MIDMSSYTFLFVVLPQVPYLFHQHALSYSLTTDGHTGPQRTPLGRFRQDRHSGPGLEARIACCPLLDLRRLQKEQPG